MVIGAGYSPCLRLAPSCCWTRSQVSGRRSPDEGHRGSALCGAAVRHRSDSTGSSRGGLARSGTADFSAVLLDPNRRANVLGVESDLEAHHAADFEVPAKQIADDLGLVFDNVEGAVLDPVAERNRPAHPDALPLRGRDLVADSLAGDLALELGEGQQHVEGQPPHAGGGVEGLGHRDERDAVRVEQLDQLGEVGKRPRQAVDLVDDDDVDLAGPTSSSSFCSAGRSIDPPEKPPSS